MADSEPVTTESPKEAPTTTEAAVEVKTDEEVTKTESNETEKPEVTETGTTGEDEESEESYEYDPEEAEVKMDFNTFEEQLEILREREKTLLEQLEFKSAKFDILKEEYDKSEGKRKTALSILHRVQTDIDQLYGELKIIQGERPWTGIPEDAIDKNDTLLFQIGYMRNCLARFETQKTNSRKELDEIKDTLRHYLFELRKIFLGIQEKLMEVLGATPPRYHPTFLLQHETQVNHDILLNQIKEIMPLIEGVRENNMRQTKQIDILQDELMRKNLEIEEYVKVSNAVE